MMTPKMRIALTNLLDTVGEGIRLSELSSQQRKLIKYADRFGYVRQSPIKDDWVVNRTGRQP